jgi:hypothetical protein
MFKYTISFAIIFVQVQFYMYFELWKYQNRDNY